ncbi:MAG: HIT domain-containing protein [Desulfobacteraceae bacterium]|nr:MAG: HIT domain-containing protein [Desulfobacteraceae bacterium]
MKVMWAPWRVEYVLSDNKENGCIFCPVENRKSDAERLILKTGLHSLVMMNRYPYNNGHLLVAPLKHAAGLEILTEAELAELMHLVSESILILKKVMKPEGFNVGLNLGRVAGAGMEDHLHFHVVPRWNGDTNLMTVMGDVRVIPEHIEQTYKKLLEHY